MSENRTKGNIPVGTIILGAGAAVGIGLVGYTFYKYFTGPQSAILDTYKAMLQDILVEEQNFYKENKTAGLSGLTSLQQKTLDSKNKYLNTVLPQVVQIVGQSNLGSWIQNVIIEIVGAVVAVAVVGVIINLVYKWFSNRVSNNLQGSSTHSYLMHWIAINEIYAEGDIAGSTALFQSVQVMYNNYTINDLQEFTTQYQQILTQIIQGTAEYIAVSAVLFYVTAELTENIINATVPLWLPAI